MSLYLTGLQFTTHVEMSQKGVSMVRLQPGLLEYYLLVINILAFFLFTVNRLSYSLRKRVHLDAVVAVAVFAGGAAGVMLANLIMGGKAAKENMMLRVYVTCMLVIQVILFLIVKGHVRSELSLDFYGYFAGHRILTVYLVAVNFVTVIAFGADKIAAMADRSRIRIITLLGLAFLGGSVGGLVAMHVFRHKTKKKYFTVGIPLIMVMQAFVIFYSMNMAV